MAETTKPKTFKESVAYWNTLPRDRRMVGYITGVLFFVFFAAIGLAIYYHTGFLSYLTLSFVMFLCSMHSNYALAYELTQRKVRKIDYWYVGAAAIGLFIFAASYSHQRDSLLTKAFVMAHQSGEEAVRQKVSDSMSKLSEFLCGSIAKNSAAPCNGAKELQAEIKPNLTVGQIKALQERFKEDITIPYGRLFRRDDLKPEYFSPLSVVLVRIDEWEDYMRKAPSRSVSSTPVEAEILLGLGHLVIWPFFLAYALALRLTKVTVDVFEWAK